MLTAYSMQQGRLQEVTLQGVDRVPEQVTWLDLLSASPAERERAAALTGVAIPSVEAVEEIEASSRFFSDDDGLQLRCFFLCSQAQPARSVTVAFMLIGGLLITIREVDLISFRSLHERYNHRDAEEAGATAVMLRLFEAQVDQLADMLEQVYRDLETLNQNVFVNIGGMELDQAMRQLAASQDLNDRVRLALFDQKRGLNFFARSGIARDQDQEVITELVGDIGSLTSHSDFLLDKVGFLVDAIRGQINLQENRILKMLSLMGAMLLPPTLIAAVYGMNFRNMPELNWEYGYPAALLLMLVAAVAPLLFFKWRKWI